MPLSLLPFLLAFWSKDVLVETLSTVVHFLSRDCGSLILPRSTLTFKLEFSPARGEKRRGALGDNKPLLGAPRLPQHLPRSRDPGATLKAAQAKTGAGEDCSVAASEALSALGLLRHKGSRMLVQSPHPTPPLRKGRLATPPQDHAGLVPKKPFVDHDNGRLSPGMALRPTPPASAGATGCMEGRGPAVRDDRKTGGCNGLADSGGSSLLLTWAHWSRARC